MDNGFFSDENAVKKSEEAGKIKKAGNRIGFSLFALSAFTFVFSILLGVLLALFSKNQQSFGSAEKICMENLLYLNEALIILSFFLAIPILKRLPADPPEKRRFGTLKMLEFFCIIIAVGEAGNLLGSLFLSIWSAISGRGVTKHLKRGDLGV